VTTAVLHRLGGDYAELAELVEQEAQGRPDWRIPPDAPEPDFPPLQVLDFVTARLVEPGDASGESWPIIETETFTVTTIVVETEDVPEESGLQPFEFETATVERHGDRWVIQKQVRQADRLIEALGAKDDVILEMVAIPSGTFLMGSVSWDGDPIRKVPQNEVTVARFFMGRYPITQTQWRVVVKTCPQVSRKLNSNPSRFRGRDRPVEHVSWLDAVEFCDRLSQYTRREYRLPSEVEWEYACRAGTTTPFHCGATITPELGNYQHQINYNNGPTGKSPGRTTPVGQYPYANAWGLSDMHGNVHEWCADHWHEDAPTDGNAWLDKSAETNARSVIRGGSWVNGPQHCRSDYRSNSLRGPNSFIGFRVVCIVPRTLP
jgi:formylglycine-generating enzyme required for sulfatase activity